MKIGIVHNKRQAVAEVERTPLTSTHKGAWKGRRSDGLTVIADTPYEAADAMGDPPTIRIRIADDLGIRWAR